MLYRDGEPVAVQIADEVRFLEDVAVELEWAIRQKLVGKRYLPISTVIQ